MKKFRIAVLIILLPFIGNAQKNDKAVKIASNIKSDDICNYVHTLASDEFGGRETGQESLIKSANYIANKFKEFGVAPGNNGEYFQNYPLKVISYKATSFHVDNVQREFIKDYFFFPDEYKAGVSSDDFVFAGYGIKDEKWDDYQNLDIKGKIVMIFGGEPEDKQGNSIITGNKNKSPWSRSRKKIRLLSEQDAAMVLYVADDYKKILKRSKSFISEDRVINADESKKKTPVLFLSPKLANKLLGKANTSVKALKKEMKFGGKSVSQTIKGNKIEFKSAESNKTIQVPNVLGYIKGTDLKEEVVVISGHFDHLGVRGKKTYNGADDNGSGTSALLSIAKAYGAAYEQGFKPRRSLLFVAVSGEEKGLLGSKYYVNNPIYPLDNTVADLNIDMIGRWDKAHKGNDNYVYLIGSDRLSTELHTISESANETYVNLELDYKFNAKNDPNMFYYRSDHYNFAKKGIPVIFYFSGVHKDYHQPGDTPDKIMCPKVEKIAKLVFYTSWELANRSNRIVVDKSDTDKDE